MAKYPVAKRFGRWGLLWFFCTIMLLVPALLADILDADLTDSPTIVGALLAGVVSLLPILAGVTSFLMLIKFSIMLVMLAVEWFSTEVDEALSHQDDD